MHQVMKWLSIGLAAPIGFFTLLAIPIHFSIGGSEARLGHSASLSTEKFSLSEAKHMTLVDGYLLRDGSFQPQKDIVIDFADGRRFFGNSVTTPGRAGGLIA